MLCQRIVELSMRITIDSHSLNLAFDGTLVGIEESSETGMLDIVYALRLRSFIGVLTEVLWPGTMYLQDQSSMKKLIFQCPDSRLLPWA
jgi:hypothetical protein